MRTIVSTMRRTAGLLGLGALVWLVPTAGFAQTYLTQTTLSAAATAGATTVTVASATNMDADDELFVKSPTGGELMRVISVSGTTITVRRGTGGTQASPTGMTHLSGAIVFLNDEGGQFFAYDVTGSCTASQRRYLPHLNVHTGRVWDCSPGGVWVERDYRNTDVTDTTTYVPWVRRDTFEYSGYLIMQDDGTAQSLADGEENFVTGFGPNGGFIYEYREEQAKTITSWRTSGGTLNVTADNTTDNEGVEILIGASEGEQGNDHAFIVAGTSGACVSASILVTDISGTDQVQIGFRINDQFQAENNYTLYNIFSVVGINATDGSIVSTQGVLADASDDTDDSAVNWADGATRALKVCVTAAGVPSAYYSGATPGTYPTYTAIAMTNTGDTLTAGTALVPFFSFMTAGTDGPDVSINWVQLESFP